LVLRLALRVVAAVCLFGAPGSLAAIAIDGVLDEPEWRQARVFDSFVTTDPRTSEPARYRTEARLYTDEKGIYVGFINYQPPGVARIQRRFARDAAIEADRNVLGIDFDGNGLIGYDFTVGAANTIQDGIFTNAPGYSGDWDGTWYSATSQDEQYWYSEIMIPWSVAPMASSGGAERTMGFYFGRVVFDESLRFAYPNASFERPTFIQDWHPTRVRKVSAATLEWFPYASLTEELEGSDTDLKVGMDVVWRPGSSTQFTGALNPDFGQVESDDLVVNFSAIETFFSEKRPFFTENQGLFASENPVGDRVVNTRRIGSQADDASDRITDIDLAAKATHFGEIWDAGFFAVTEDDPGDAKGGDYVSTRVQRRLGGLTLGHSLTWADRPTLDREATVNALDLDWEPAAGMRLRGQALYSDLQQDANRFNGDEDIDEQGVGGWVEWRYAPNDTWQYQLNGTYYGDDFEMNDLGFLQRNDWLELFGRVRYDVLSYPADSRLRSAYYELKLGHQENTDGDNLPSRVLVDGSWTLRDTRELKLIVGYQPDSKDDLITRGNGILKMDAQRNLELRYLNPRGRRFTFDVGYKAETAGTDEFSHQIDFSPQWYITDRLTLSGEASYTYYEDWLLWDFRSQQLATYETDLYDLNLKLDWYPAPRQELRVKFQWVGVEADARRGYGLSNSGRLQPSGVPVDDFSISDMAIQVRYRYELAPLSEFFLVYTRGGYWEDEDTGESAFGLFNNAWDEVTLEQVLAKIRYRF
jgi:hypothetical protein